MSDDAAFARKFAELGAQFRAELPARLAEIRAHLAAGEPDEVRAIAHRLAGRGGTFGAPDITAAGRAVEEADRAALPAAVDALAAVIGG